MSNSPQISIHPATPADVPVILNFIRKLAEYEKLSHQMQATEELLREHLFGPRPAAETVIANLAGQPVGFALFFQTFSTFVGKPGIWLEDLFVLPEHRGKGIGKALLAHVASIAVARNCGRMEWSVLDWNSPAIDFYKSVGAVPMDDWTTYRIVGDKLAALAKRT
ncbi:MAG: GNAT family N-acetyltransferase [Tepidisphaeraceae bacterium]|jgi:GNAT superfamily N-acetyltransferase